MWMLAAKEGVRGGTNGSPTHWNEYRIQVSEWELEKYLTAL